MDLTLERILLFYLSCSIILVLELRECEVLVSAIFCDSGYLKQMLGLAFCILLTRFELALAIYRLLELYLL